MADITIKFGKFKNKNISELLENKPYCVWLLNQTLLMEKYPDIKHVLKKFIKKDEIYLHFGKYKNKPLSYVYTTDKSYIQYLKNNEYILTQCASYIDFINEMEKKAEIAKE